MALNNLWGKLGAFSRNVLVPSNVIYKSFDADPLVSDKMSRAISRWYGMYVDKPEWADDEVKPLGLPRAIAKEFAQVVSSEMTITADGGPRADFINEQLTRFQSNVQNSIELCMALGGMAFKLGVTSIGEGAFEGCSGLTSLTLPSGVTSIGRR